MPSAVAEVLRWKAPVQGSVRQALVDASLGGASIAAGEKLILLLGAANRDPAVFPDPDTFDVGRFADNADPQFTPVGPLRAFGGGEHTCSGSLLAKLEMELAMEHLLDRYRRLSFAGEPPVDAGFMLRSAPDLHLLLHPDRRGGHRDPLVGQEGRDHRGRLRHRAGTALRFAAEGASVVCVDRDLAGAQETVTMITEKGGTALAHAADVAVEADAEAMVAACVDAYGGLDVLYANAGIPGVGTGADTTLEAWQRVIDVNLTGVFLSDKYALRRLLAQGTGGSIVNQASVGGLVGVAGIAPYAAAKAGVIGLTRQLAVEYGPQQIRVNALCPGTVPTPLVRATYEARGGFGTDTGESVDETLEMQRTLRFPLGRLGTEEDVAMAAVYLGSDESTWITGQVWAVDGGQTAA
ncbi:SDR family oxidoreductase [Pseudonocardia benzenivorans]